MGMEWKEVKLGDYCDAQNGFAFNSNSFIEDGKYNVIKIKELKDGGILFTPDTAKVDDSVKIEKYKIYKDDVLFALTGDPVGRPNPLSRVGRVSRYNNTLPAVLNQRVCKLLFSNEIDPKFVYYYFRQDNVFYTLASCAKGSASQANISTKDILNTNIRIPQNIEDQKRIADILSSLDAKIENNNKINAKLEEMAQAIFKSWFIDFEPFKDGKFVESELGMIPEGWKVVTLGSQCVCLLGGTPSRNKEEYWGGNINWINSGEINKFRILTPSEKITSLGLSKSATKLLPAKTTVLAITGATLGQVSLLEIDSCANQSVIGVLQNELMPYEFVYPLINEAITELVTHQTGGAQQHINKDNVESLKIILPNIDIINSYKTVVAPIYSKIANLCFENLNLEKTRDTLLPKLMSGEIEL